LIKKHHQLQKKIYNFIDESTFYYCPIKKEHRSRMNVVFRINTENTTEIESTFAKEATLHGLAQLAGHRAVGGLRASFYNAVPDEAVDVLIEFMQEFQRKYQH